MTSLFLKQLQRLIKVEPEETIALAWAFVYFFSLLCSYYIIRPVRDAMGITGGVDQLQWLFTGTFLVMLLAVPLFGWLTSRFKRSQFLPAVYLFFIANLLAFYGLFVVMPEQTNVARGFFIWASVFNLFVVSVFWSFMADLFNDAQAKRLFGVIAAGGTCGALMGPALTTVLSSWLEIETLLIMSALFLLLALYCIHHLLRWRSQQRGGPTRQPQAELEDQKLGGGVLGGIRLLLRSPYLSGIALMMLLFTTLSTFLYFQQAQIIADAFSSPAERTRVFAGIDLLVNALTLIGQILITGRLVKAIGVGWSLALVPLFLCVGFLALAVMPVLSVLVVVQVLRRVGNYAISRPAREMLYVVVSAEEKYKAKNVNDTLVYRGGDAISAWLYAGLRSLGLSLSQLALIAVPLAIIWAVLCHRLGVWQSRLAQAGTLKSDTDSG